MSTYLFLTGPDNYYAQVAELLGDKFGVWPSIWIGKRPVTDFARDNFPECEVLEISEVVSSPTPFRPLSPGEFALLTDYWNSQEFSSYRVNLAEEYNRYLSLDSLTMMERESLVRKLQIVLIQALAAKRPEFVLSIHPPHNPLSLAAWHLCEWLDIPTLYFQSAQTFAPILLPGSTIRQRLPYPHPLSQATPPEDFEGRQEIRFMAEKIVRGLKSGEKMFWEKIQTDRLGSLKKSRFHQLNDLKQDVKRMWQRLRDPKSAITGDYVENRYHQLIDAHALLPKSVEEESFGYFALHYQPEATSVPMGLEDSYHGESVRKARALLPMDVPLIVKEHPSQIGWQTSGFRGRTGSFYSFIDALPNTKMVSAHTPKEQLMRGASVIFTLTGTIGLEAVVRGIPVVYFGIPWWEGMPGTRAYGEIDSTFEEWIPEPAKIDAVVDFLEDLAANRGIPHFVDSWADWWGNLNGDEVERIGEGFVSHCAEAVSAFVEGEVGRRHKRPNWSDRL